MLEAEITGPVADPWGNTSIGLSATGKLNRKDFGLTWNVVTEAGGLLVGDDVKLAHRRRVREGAGPGRGRSSRPRAPAPDATRDEAAAVALSSADRKRRAG